MVAFIPFPDINPVIFRLGPLTVRWYGVAYVLGFLIGYIMLRRMAERGILHISVDALSRLVGWLVLGVIVGGRGGWWLVYHRGAAAAEPWYEPIAIWHGGMSFHGALVAVAAVLLLWSWIARASFWNLVDCVGLVAPIGLFLGRIANFVNAELVGRPTNVPWGVMFPGEAIARHPSQLYEAVLEGPLLLLLLLAIRKWHRPPEGTTAAQFLMLYGVLRFAVEFTRQPDEQVGFIAFGWLTMGQLLSTVLAAAGVTLWLASARDWHRAVLPPEGRGH